MNLGMDKRGVEDRDRIWVSLQKTNRRDPCGDELFCIQTINVNILEVDYTIVL